MQSAAIAAFQLDSQGQGRYLSMRVPYEMRQLAGTAEFLAVEVAARHFPDPATAQIVTDCQAAVQGWASSRYRKDDYRNVAGGFWRLMKDSTPGELLKVKSHVSKEKAALLGIPEHLRRGNEIVDGLVGQCADRAYEPKQAQAYAAGPDAR